VWLVNSPSIIDNVQFLENTSGNPSLPVEGLLVEGGSPVIQNSLFGGNDYGIHIKDWQNPDTGEMVLGTPDIKDTNAFENNIIKDIFP
jgi:hypothetical protein